VLDLGCGSGKLLAHLIRQRGLEEIVGVDVSSWPVPRSISRGCRKPRGGA
jgi:cyclopropane fatty-acyl-phospholipid synthase-like methyltransferase